MRIVENTPSVLRLKDGKLWMNAVCFGAAAIVAIASLNKLGDLRQLFPAGFVAILGLVFLRSSDVTSTNAPAPATCAGSKSCA